MKEAADRLPPEALYPYGRHNQFRVRTTQTAVRVQEVSDTNRQRWSLQASWDGSVTTTFDLRPEPEDAARILDTALFANVVLPASNALEDLVSGLGGYGRAYVALTVRGHRFEIQSMNGSIGRIPRTLTTPIQTWTDSEGAVGGETLDRMRRELCRASGATVWEPED